MKQHSKLIRIVRWAALVLAVVCAGYLVYWYYGSHKNRQQAEDAAAQYLSTQTAGQAAEDTETTSAPAESAAVTEPAEDSVQVDFDALQAVSSDVIGWIRVDGIDIIDYPVVHRDDSYYLTHSWDGEIDRYGAIFMEEANTPDFSDYHTILYGHSMLDSSMFGSLELYADPDFFAEHGGRITIYTPEGTRVYQIFSAEYADDVEPGVYTVGFSPSEEYTEFLTGLLSRSLYDAGVTLRGSDRVLTLSTCSYGEKARFVVHALELTE